MLAFTSEGKLGLISYVESSNFASLKSVYRMATKKFGLVYVIKVLGKYRSYRTPKCKEYDFRFERV